MKESRQAVDTPQAGEARAEWVADQRAARRRYDRPRLSAYGTLRDLTMGPTPGIGESGPASTYQEHL